MAVFGWVAGVVGAVLFFSALILTLRANPTAIVPFFRNPVAVPEGTATMRVTGSAFLVFAAVALSATIGAWAVVVALVGPVIALIVISSHNRRLAARQAGNSGVAPIVVSRVRLSTWLRVVLATSFGLLAIALASTAVARLTMTGLDGVVIAEVIGATVLLALSVSSIVATCTVQVTPERVTMRFWILFRATVKATDVAELRADEWNSWNFGGYGLKGGPKRGWLLNATADGSGAGDTGVLVRTATGRAYRIEVPHPQRFAQQAAAVLSAR